MSAEGTPGYLHPSFWFLFPKSHPYFYAKEAFEIKYSLEDLTQRALVLDTLKHAKVDLKERHGKMRVLEELRRMLEARERT